MTAVSERFNIVFHVHDELICEVPADSSKEALKDITDIFSYNAPWSKGLPLNGAGYCTPFYMKD
jgi:DNA polymerase